MNTFTLSKAQRSVVAAVVRDRNPQTFGERIHDISDEAVLREINWQLKHNPNSVRAQAVAARLAKLTGRQPATGRADMSWVRPGRGAQLATLNS